MLAPADIGTSVFSAHSTRCASASKAIATISADMLLRAAGWSEESTFQKFYGIPFALTNQMCFSVLK